MAKRRTGVNRREFLKQGAVAAGTVVLGSMAGCASNGSMSGHSGVTGVTIYHDPNDSIGSSATSKWAAEHLRKTLAARNVPVSVVSSTSDVNPAHLRIDVTQLVPAAGSFMGKAPDNREVLSLRPSENRGQRSLTAGGTDARGVAYALTELADVVALSPDPIASLLSIKETSEAPANSVRSVMRMICSDIEDKGWYHDRDFWRDYLTMLVTHRYNRFNLSFGLGYDFARDMLDTYFYFAYPFLVKVPGYDVRATNLTDAERDQNLELLRFISDECALRGLHFQLGLWTHAYQWANSPRVNYNIEGLTADKHAVYCRDALTLVLKECPNISGVTFRIHGESGVNEGSYDFWKTVFTGVVNTGRPLPIDMHAKGMDQGMIDTALSTGLPITISPKYWAEHMGLPYHQAAIRPTELPTRARGNALMALSTGERSFTRYGYGDLLPEDRKYGIIHRMWPGTQRLLVWGDPVFAASYGRSSQFCGSLGCEIMEPLSFKGRKGSGNTAGGRTAYKDASLRPKFDFEKYTYTYRLWGRLMYNPDAKPETWQRELKHTFGPAAENVEPALASASRILPLFTTAHTPSAANNNYWPEMYVNMSIVNTGPNAEPYNDTPTPRRFGTVSPLDPQMFSRIEDHVDELMKGEPSIKYSPAEVAKWLEQFATTAAEQADAADHRAGRISKSPEYRRMKIEIDVQSALGLFFAEKLRAGLCYAVYERTTDPAALQEAIKRYRSARAHWARIIELTKGVYVEDVTVGIGWFQRGHWSDRIEAIDHDIAAMAKPTVAQQTQSAAKFIPALLSPPSRPIAEVVAVPIEKFKRGQAVPIGVSVRSNQTKSVTLYYRHTHQAEAWQTVAMQSDGGRFSASIPAEYTDTPQPLLYYFEIRNQADQPVLYPGFNATLSNQPYFVIRQDRA